MEEPCQHWVEGYNRDTKFGVITIELLVLWAHCRLILLYFYGFHIKDNF